jgi:hypothetical protein
MGEAIRPSQRKPPGGLARAMRNIEFMEAQYQLSVTADMTADDRMAQIKIAVLEKLRTHKHGDLAARQIENYNDAAFANFIDECVTEKIQKHRN